MPLPTFVIRSKQLHGRKAKGSMKSDMKNDLFIHARASLQTHTRTFIYVVHTIQHTHSKYSVFSVHLHERQSSGVQTHSVAENLGRPVSRIPSMLRVAV